MCKTKYMHKYTTESNMFLFFVCSMKFCVFFVWLLQRARGHRHSSAAAAVVCRVALCFAHLCICPRPLPGSRVIRHGVPHPAICSHSCVRPSLQMSGTLSPILMGFHYYDAEDYVRRAWCGAYRRMSLLMLRTGHTGYVLSVLWYVCRAGRAARPR